MSRGVRIGIIVVIVILSFVVAAVLVAPRLFQIDAYRPGVISLLEEKTGRQVEIGHLSLALFPRVAIRADNVAISNPPGFPAGNWLTVERLNAQLDLGALWDRQILVRTLRLDRPTLNLISNGQGQWNFQISDPPTPKAAQPSDPPLFSLEKITRVVLTDGTVFAKSLAFGPAATPVACEGISGDLDNINLVALSAPSTKPPAIPNATGDLSVATFSVGAVQATQVSSKIEASPAGIQLNDLHFSLYGGKGTGSIRLDLAGADPQFQAQARMTGVNVQKLLEAFPAWRGELTGQLDTNLNVSGDANASSDFWAGKRGEGTVIIRNGRLPKLGLNKSLLDLAHLAQLGSAKGDLSAFSLISLDWQLAGDIISSRRIHIVGTGITVDGSGSSDLTGPGHLHYQGVAKMEARQNALSSMLAGLAGSELKNGRINFPFVLGGTFGRPALRLNPHSQPGAPAVATRPK